MSVFEDKIDNYSNGASGTLTTPSGQTVDYTVASNANTRDWGDVDDGAQIQQSNGWVEVSFDEPVQNAAIYISSANVGEEYVVEVDGQPTDLNAMIAAGQATFHNLGGNQIVNADGELTATGSWTGYDTAVLQFHVPVTSLKVSGDGSGGGWDIFDIGFAGSSLPCFCAGTQIATPFGPVAVEELRIGELVRTRDHGAQPILWTGAREVPLQDQVHDSRMRPVLVEKGALGPAVPARPLRLSRQHRVLLTPAIHGVGKELLVPVAKLIGWPGISVTAPKAPAVFHHLLFAQHQILLAEGAPCESLFWGARSPLLFPQAFRAVSAKARLHLMTMTPARPFVRTKSDLRAAFHPLKSV